MTKRLEDVTVKLLQKAYENESIDILVRSGKVTNAQAEHFLEYVDEYSDKVIVYLSVNGNAKKELFNNIRRVLLDEGCIVRFHEKGAKYDKYKLYNADICIILPYEEGTFQYVIGRGNEGEAAKAIEHNLDLYFSIDETNTRQILDTEKIEDSNDWLATAMISDFSEQIGLIGLIADTHERLKITGRKISIKDKIEMI